jgi:AAA15 family ATPase/GTPase|nr:ATP-binding protein [uncultured Acetatifactor sp.]
MLIELRAKNCFSFSEKITFSAKADMRNKKFASNVYSENYFNILKALGIYGPNNAGKTCLVKCIRSARNILLNREPKLMENIFQESSICEIGISFLEDGREFSYDFWYDTKKEEYPYEKFSEVNRDQYGNMKETIWLLKDSIRGDYQYEDEELLKVISVISQSNLMFYLADVGKFEKLAEMKRVCTAFASRIDIIDMNNIPIKHTIELMKAPNELQQKIVGFIKNADLYLDSFEYVDIDKVRVKPDREVEKPEEKALDIPEQIMDQIRLVSVYKGVHVPSILFDSTGTKKIAALASYIIEGIEQGRILVVDELDSSLHFKLTRAIVAMFNNELNMGAQLIFTIHDINLMDCKKMFRKEQIWFVHKDKSGVYVYSLGDFTAQQGVRDTTDIMEKYRRGVLGALPDPELIDSLLDMKGNRKEVSASGE